MSEFVFAEKDGALAFVGDFDGLYKAERDPWGQSAQDGDMAHYYRFSRQRIAETLRAHGASGKGFEVGCGHGHAMKHLRRFGPVMQWTGGDISPTAIEVARQKYPGMQFMVCDVADYWDAPVPEQFDVVLLNQTLWYVLADLDNAVRNCCTRLKPDGLFVVSQAFLKTEQRYGRSIADGFYGALITLVRKYPGLRLVEARYDDTGEHIHNDGLLAFRKVL